MVNGAEGGGEGEGGGARKGTRNEEITQVKKHDAHLSLAAQEGVTIFNS